MEGDIEARPAILIQGSSPVNLGTDLGEDWLGANELVPL